MSRLFTTIIDMSFTGAVIIVVIILIRLFMKKLPKKYSYDLWMISLIRLICPLSVSSALSFFNFFKTPAEINCIDFEYVESAAPSLITATPYRNFDITCIFQWIWLAGTVSVMVYSIFAYINVYRKVFGSVRLDGYYICKNIESPFVFGIFRPKIYIPDNISNEDLQCILSHEKAHIKRRDYIVKLLWLSALALHWFNPLVWLSFKLMNVDMELSCDEIALKGYSAVYRKAYANALLNISMRQNKLNESVLGFSESNIQRRIKGVLNVKKTSAAVSIISSITIAVTALCLLTNAESDVMTEENPADNHNILLQEELPQGSDSILITNIDVRLFPLDPAYIKENFKDPDHIINFAAKCDVKYTDSGESYSATVNCSYTTTIPFEEKQGVELDIGNDRYQCSLASVTIMNIIADHLRKGECDPDKWSVPSTISVTLLKTEQYYTMVNYTDNNTVSDSFKTWIEDDHMYAGF